MSFALHNPEDISSTEAMYRMRNLTQTQRNVIDKERYRTDETGKYIGIKAALIWLDINARLTSCCNKKDIEANVVLFRVNNAFRDSTTRVSAQNIIRQYDKDN